MFFFDKWSNLMKYILILYSIALSACGTTSEITQLRAQLHEQTTIAQLSAQRTTELEKQYSDMYFLLDSLTVDSFKEKVARGETVYAYIGRPSCGDCNAFELQFKQLIKQHQLSGKIYFVNVHFLQQDKPNWLAFRQQFHLSGTPVLAKYSKGQLVNKWDFEEHGSLKIQDVEKWLKSNQL